MAYGQQDMAYCHNVVLLSAVQHVHIEKKKPAGIFDTIIELFQDQFRLSIGWATVTMVLLARYY